jgi:hypothetical protein
VERTGMLTVPLPGAKERNQTTGRETEIFPKLTASQLRVKEGNKRERKRKRQISLCKNAVFKIL